MSASNPTASASQFDALFSRRVAILNGHQQHRPERWQIWLAQERDDQSACFSTAHRDVCNEQDCHWRDTCVALRAEWRR